MTARSARVVQEILRDIAAGQVGVMPAAPYGKVYVATVSKLTPTRVVLDSGDWYPADTLERQDLQNQIKRLVPVNDPEFRLRLARQSIGETVSRLNSLYRQWGTTGPTMLGISEMNQVAQRLADLTDVRSGEWDGLL